MSCVCCLLWLELFDVCVIVYVFLLTLFLVVVLGVCVCCSCLVAGIDCSLFVVA